MRLFITLCVFGPIALGSRPMLALDPSFDYLKSPIAIEEAQNLEAVLRDLPTQKAKWSEYAKLTLTYVVRQYHSGLLAPDPCESLPIRVRISNGQLESARYEASGGRCHRGQALSRKSVARRGLYLSPDDFFARIAGAQSQLQCYKHPQPSCPFPSSLRVTYDEKLGLPIKLEDYSELVSDWSWYLEVKEIQFEP